MSPTRKRAQAPVLVVLLLAAGLLSGCGVSSDDKPSSAASDSASPEATEPATPTESASPSPSPSETVQSPTAAPSPTLAPSAALLTAQEMPRVNDQLAWRLVRTGPVGSNPFGVCAKFDVVSIGAEQGVERSFVAGPTKDPVYAGQQIATFPDSSTTARAEKVLQAWQRTCASRLFGPHHRVTPIQAVPVPVGRAWWYLTSYADHPGLSSSQHLPGHFETFGVVVSGNRITMIRMGQIAQDHDYPPGQDPMQLAVKAAAGKLG
jgi:hypothetical protein